MCLGRGRQPLWPNKPRDGRRARRATQHALAARNGPACAKQLPPQSWAAGSPLQGGHNDGAPSRPSRRVEQARRRPSHLPLKPLVYKLHRPHAHPSPPALTCRQQAALAARVVRRDAAEWHLADPACCTLRLVGGLDISFAQDSVAEGEPAPRCAVRRAAFVRRHVRVRSGLAVLLNLCCST